MKLSETIIQAINSNGPISFRDYMELALYHPLNGYYAASENIIGENGDFFTSPSLTPAFGYAIAKQIEAMWKLTGENNFTIVEYGAGTGMLCHDILSYFKNHSPLYEQLNYVIIEKSATMRQKEKSLPAKKVKWIKSLKEISPFCGCVLSNELLDNFSVHRVVMQKSLMEIMVDFNDGFCEKLIPANQDLINYFSELNAELFDGLQTEANLQAIEWLKEIYESMEKGFLLTIDYGNLSSKLYHQHRKEGTLLCYYKHSINDNPYLNIGQQDITAHVNFSALIHYGNKLGFHPIVFTEQATFLLAWGFKQLLLQTLDAKEGILQQAKREAAISRLLLFEMGQKIKVLIQSKNIENPLFENLNINARSELNFNPNH